MRPIKTNIKRRRNPNMHEIMTQQINNTTNISKDYEEPSKSLIDTLLEKLNNTDLDYCHWKSNYFLSQSLLGEIDLDFLIQRNSLSKMLTLLMNLGFKQAKVSKGIQEPGIYHLYGLDMQSGKIIHVHLFNHVLTGESFIKSHLLPLNKMLFKKTRFNGNVRTPSKSAELVLFILRTYIKYGSLLDIFYLLKHQRELTEEFKWLSTDIDLSESLQLLSQYCPVIEEKLFTKCIDILASNGSLFKRVTTALSVRKRLRIYSRYNWLKRFVAYTGLISKYIIQKIFGNKSKKMLSSGGSIIAFVGPEATGKSTLVSESEEWLGKIFNVKNIHAGKPPSAWLTYLLNLLIPISRKIIPGFRTSRVEKHVLNSKSNTNILADPKSESSLFFAIRAVSLAWDRRKLLIKARRRAMIGDIIICDRYPSETIGAMDSPRLRENANVRGIRMTFYNFLARLEAKLYRQIPPPDLVLQLKVSLEVAKQRNRERIKNGKESDEYIESRHMKNKGWQLSDRTSVHDIDTDQPLDKTLLSVKKQIWEAL